MLYMAVNKLTVYDNSVSKWTNLDLGSNGQVLTVDNTVANTNLKWSNPSTGTVTQVTAGTGLSATPNPITSTGTISIASSGVTAGTYTLPVIAVNAQGQITSASNGANNVYKVGVATLTNSTVTITDANITSSSRIVATYDGGVTFDPSLTGNLYYVASAGSATINSTQAGDNNSVAYTIWY